MSIALPFQQLVQHLQTMLPDNQEKSLALKAVEDAYIFALRSIAAEETDALLRNLTKEMNDAGEHW